VTASQNVAAASIETLREPSSHGVTAAAAGLQLRLLRGFELRNGDAVVRLPLSGQRVVAFLALHDRPVQRLFVAGSLWLDSSEERANASLRTALWRLRRPGCRVVDVTSSHVTLAAGVEVDLHDAAEAARAAIARRVESAGAATERLAVAGELLPDWYEDWVLLERERFRLLRLHALEALCDELAQSGRYAEAIEAGLAAVAGEPLRESAHRAVIRAYLSEGNAIDAIRQYRLFRDLLHAELGLEPSPELEALVAALPVVTLR
jgi:DNA-binding SARP family transcriptional activator